MSAKSIRGIALLLTLAATSALWVGCSDVGDSSAIPGPDGAADSTLESGPGIGPSDDSSTPGDDTSSTGDDTSSFPDTGTVGADTGIENEAGGDSEAMDSGVDSTSGEDAADSSAHDSGMDSAVEPMDSGADTSAPQDTGVDAPADSGADSGSPADTGTDTGADTGVDTGVDTGGGPLTPCTTAGQTNCVQCDGWSTMHPNLCTPTEAAIVQRDIDKGHATAAGPEPNDVNGAFRNDACYECLFYGGCLDDDVFGDTGHECGDPLTVGTSDQCMTTFNCELSSACAVNDVSTCYCGTAGVTTACQGNPAPGPINGMCASQIAAGLGFSEKDGTDCTKKISDTTRASGVADQIFTCAVANACSKCFQ